MWLFKTKIVTIYFVAVDYIKVKCVSANHKEWKGQMVKCHLNEWQENMNCAAVWREWRQRC